MSRGPVRPSPAGWYDDPYEAGRERFFDGTHWLEETRTAPAASPVPDAVAPPDEELVEAPFTPRTRRLRLLLAIAGLVPFFGLIVLLTHVPYVGRVLAVPVLAASIALTAPLVSGRRSDAAFVFVPLYNIYLPCRIAWRLAYLPYRDWAPRPDEEASLRQIRCPDRPDQVLYLRQKQLG